MADFGDLGGQTDNEADEEQQAAGQGSAIRGGLLNPSTFPSIMPSGSDRLAIAPQPAIFSGSLDRDVHAEVLQDILDAQAKFPSPAPALGAEDPANWDRGWLDPPAPLITGPLDTDTHAEVLRDIRNAQAQLPPPSRSKSAASSNPTTYQLLYKDSRAGQIPSLFSTSAGPGQLPKFTAGYGVQLNTNGPALIQRGGQAFRTIDTGKAERLVPDVRVSAGGPVVPALTSSEAFQKNLQENVIDPSLFMISGGEAIPTGWEPSGTPIGFPADMAAAKGYPGIGTTANGGPTFADTPYLYPVAEGQLNVVGIPLTGSKAQRL